MKRVVLIISVLLSLAVSSVSYAVPGDTWVLNIASLEGSGWTEHSGAGYNGTSAWEASGQDGYRRIYWKLDALTIPTLTELYTIEWYRPSAGANNWQPIESQFNGASGEIFPMDPNIPWAGMWGTNHQYIGAGDPGTPGTPGTWVSTGPGPHTPENTAYNAGANGIYMWLKQGSWLYAKWDYGWPIDNTWSALRITQITGTQTVPEPTTMLLLLLGLFGLAGIRRKL